jgi:hypothetical protein
MRRSSAKGVSVQRTRPISSTASPADTAALTSHGPTATSPWKGSSTPRYVQASLQLGNSSCQPPP